MPSVGLALMLLTAAQAALAPAAARSLIRLPPAARCLPVYGKLRASQPLAQVEFVLPNKRHKANKNETNVVHALQHTHIRTHEAHQYTRTCSHNCILIMPGSVRRIA